MWSQKLHADFWVHRGFASLTSMMFNSQFHYKYLKIPHIKNSTSDIQALNLPLESKVINGTVVLTNYLVYNWNYWQLCFKGKKEVRYCLGLNTLWRKADRNTHDTKIIILLPITKLKFKTIPHIFIKSKGTRQTVVSILPSIWIIPCENSFQFWKPFLEGTVLSFGNKAVIHGSLRTLKPPQGLWDTFYKPSILC